MEEKPQAHEAVSNSLKALINTYAQSQSLPTIAEPASLILDDKVPFMQRVDKLDQLIDENKGYEPLSEILFDLLLVHFLSAESNKEDYFDSPEWNEIEDKTIDRGTELLNLFLYISEANESEAEITLDDFLNEFLLVGDDEFQDEYRIYESLIINEDLIEMELADLRKVQQTVKADTGLQDYFIPLVLFFQEAEGMNNGEIPGAELSAFEKAALESLLAFNLE